MSSIIFDYEDINRRMNRKPEVIIAVDPAKKDSDYEAMKNQDTLKADLKHWETIDAKIGDILRIRLPSDYRF